MLGNGWSHRLIIKKTPVIGLRNSPRREASQVLKDFKTAWFE